MSTTATFVAAALPAQLGIHAGNSPQVAYNEASELYLVTWEEYWVKGPATFGRFLRANGTFAGGAVQIAPNGGFQSYAEDARVAPVAGSQYDFVVVALGGDVGRYPLVAAVSPGRRSLAIPIRSSELWWSVDVGGEVTTVDDDVVVVAQGGRQSSVEAFEVDVDTQTVHNQATLATSLFAGGVAISRTGGEVGRYLVTWTERTSLFGAIVDRDVNVLVPAFVIAPSGVPEGGTKIDGDGTSWIVASTRQNGTSSDVVCRGVTYDQRTASAHVTGPVVVAGEPAAVEDNPSVRWMGESYIVGYSFGIPGQDPDLFVKSVEFLGCGPCEGVFPIATSSVAERDLRLAAGPGRDQGLAVWERGFQVLGTFFFTDDGEVVNLGGGCGAGGTAAASCAAVAAPGFGMRVQGAEPNASGWLVLGANPASFPCGPCTLVPLPLVALPVATDQIGGAQVVLSLGSNPSYRGLALLAQWTLLAPGGCGPGLSFSNAIRVTIE